MTTLRTHGQNMETRGKRQKASNGRTGRRTQRRLHVGMLPPHDGQLQRTAGLLTAHGVGVRRCLTLDVQLVLALVSLQLRRVGGGGGLEGAAKQAAFKSEVHSSKHQHIRDEDPSISIHALCQPHT